jgi:hypothetical protein
VSQPAASAAFTSARNRVVDAIADGTLNKEHAKDKLTKLAGQEAALKEELDIPCVIHRYAGKLPDPADVRTNVDVCKFLYRRRRA